MQDRGTASAKVFSNLKGTCRDGLFLRVLWCLQGKGNLTACARLELLMGPAVAHWFSS